LCNNNKKNRFYSKNAARTDTQACFTNKKTKPIHTQKMTVTYDNAKRRLFILHAFGCLAAIFTRAHVNVPKTVLLMVFDFTTVVFLGETVWTLNFFNCRPAHLSADTSAVLPSVCATKAFKYVMTAIVAATAAYSSVQTRRSPLAAAIVAACSAACAYSVAARHAYAKTQTTEQADTAETAQATGIGFAVRH
jgi:hypothetical protein